jgi:hypothetical protein
VTYPLGPVVATLEIPVPDDDTTVEVAITVRRAARPAEPVKHPGTHTVD